MNKKKLWYAVLAVLLIAFCVIPFHHSNCILRFHYSDIEETEPFFLFYATNEDNELGGDKTIEAFVNPDLHVIEFVIPDDLHGDITTLRLDFPPTDQTIAFDSAFVTAASVARKTYLAERFFAPECIMGTNGIDAIQSPQSEVATYIVTSGGDPYIVLSDEIVKVINRSFSSYFVTKLILSLFIGGVIFLYDRGKRS